MGLPSQEASFFDLSPITINVPIFGHFLWYFSLADKYKNILILLKHSLLSKELSFDISKNRLFKYYSPIFILQLPLKQTSYVSIVTATQWLSSHLRYFTWEHALTFLSITIKFLNFFNCFLLKICMVEIWNVRFVAIYQHRGKFE